MGAQYSLFLTVEKNADGDERISSATIDKTPSADRACSTELVVPIPHGLNLSKDFYLYVPSVRVRKAGNQSDCCELLARGCISVLQDTFTDPRKLKVGLKQLLEEKICELNEATVKTTEVFELIVASAVENSGLRELKTAHELKTAYKMEPSPDKPSGASEIYKCQIVDDCGEVKMEKVCSSTYVWLRDESMTRDTVLNTKVALSSNWVGYCTPIEWKTIFELLQTIRFSSLHRPAMSECLKIQKQIDKLEALSDAVRPHVKDLGVFGKEISNKCYFKSLELKEQINSACSKILFGK